MISVVFVAFSGYITIKSIQESKQTKKNSARLGSYSFSKKTIQRLQTPRILLVDRQAPLLIVHIFRALLHLLSFHSSTIL